MLENITIHTTYIFSCKCSTSYTITNHYAINNVDYTPVNAVTINESGNYESNYSPNVISTNSATLSNIFSDGENANYSGSVIVALNARDVIDIIITQEKQQLVL